MKKLTKIIGFMLAILIISVSTYAVYHISPWKTRSGDSVGEADKIWSYVHSEYFYAYKNAFLVLEGDTEDAYETTIQIAEPTADNTLTIPNDSGMFLISELTTNAPDAANSIWGESNLFVFEGSSADAYETSLTVTNPTADRTITFPNASGTVVLGETAGETNSVSFGTGTIVFEGATQDAYETSLAVTDPTADRTLTFPNASGTLAISTLSTNAPEVANSLWFASNSLVFEGATANDFEGSITLDDVTADRTWTFPDASGYFMLGIKSGETNSVEFGNSSIATEGSKQDDYETTLTFTNPTADRTVTVPDASGTVVLGILAGETDSVSLGSSSIIAEGASQDAYEMTLAFANPTADRTLTLPDYTGGLPLIIGQGSTQTQITDTTAVDITGSSVTLPAGWFTAGKALRYTLGGTKTNANGTAMILVDIGATRQTLTSSGNTAGDWYATITISEHTDTANQDIIGMFVGADGAVCGYDAATVDVSGETTVKLQLDLGHADDEMTCEYIVIEHWNK